PGGAKMTLPACTPRSSSPTRTVARPLAVEVGEFEGVHGVDSSESGHGPSRHGQLLGAAPTSGPATFTTNAIHSPKQAAPLDRSEAPGLSLSAEGSRPMRKRCLPERPKAEGAPTRHGHLHAVLIEASAVHDE